MAHRTTPVAASFDVMINGNCVEVMASMPENSVDSIVTDPPYGLEFMGKGWDKLGNWQSSTGFTSPGIGDRKIPWPSFSSTSRFGAANPTCVICGGRLRGAKTCSCEQPHDHWKPIGKRRKLPDDTPDDITGGGMSGHLLKMQLWHHSWALEALRVLKPGGHMLVAGIGRTHHRMMVAVEDAGFEIRDCIYHLFGCLSADTEILIDGQWEPYRKIKEGSLALCYNREHDSFEWAPITGVHIYPYQDIAYRIQSDTTDQIVSRGHRCLVEQDGKYVFQIAEDLAQKQEAHVPVLEDLPNLLRDLPSVGESPTLCQQRGPQTVRASRYTRPDLVRIEPIHYDGIVWCVEVPTKAFVARRNGKVFITGNTGFPKGMDVSKAIDQAAGAERQIVGKTRGFSEGRRPGFGDNFMDDGWVPPEDGSKGYLTAPATDAAKQWEGWNTALKPAAEVWVLFRKPLSEKTVAANVLRWGTGGLNIAGCRIGTTRRTPASLSKNKTPNDIYGTYGGGASKELDPNQGRWPANVVLDESAVRELDEQAPQQRSGKITPYNYVPTTGVRGIYGHYGNQITQSSHDDDREGGVSRFFYIAKASKKERWFHCSECVDAFPESDRADHHHDLTDSNHLTSHPTVKPLSLMKWLVRLVTPPDGLVLDPFSGTGSTLVAALQEDFIPVGIEQDERYAQIATARMFNA